MDWEKRKRKRHAVIVERRAKEKMPCSDCHEINRLKKMLQEKDDEIEVLRPDFLSVK